MDIFWVSIGRDVKESDDDGAYCAFVSFKVVVYKTITSERDRRRCVHDNLSFLIYIAMKIPTARSPPSHIVFPK